MCWPWRLSPYWARPRTVPGSAGDSKGPGRGCSGRDRGCAAGLPSDPRSTVRAWLQRLGALHLPASGWLAVTGLALANWLADVAVLAVSIHSVGAAVPWHVLLLVYGSGVAAQSLNLTPGGLGLAEGTLALALIAAGLHGGQALAAVLLYRLASFWLVAFTGWLVFLWLRRRRPGRRVTPLLPAGTHRAWPGHQHGRRRWGARPRSGSAARAAGLRRRLAGGHRAAAAHAARHRGRPSRIWR